MHGQAPWYNYHAPLLAPMARLVGALPHEVAVMNSLTVNLHLMLTSFYRPEGRRRKILIEAGAFPSDRYAVATHLATRGLDPAAGILEVAPRPGEALLRTEDLEALLDQRGREVAVVLLPGVQYYTGQLLDLPRLAEAAHRAGAVAGFDLAHAAGNVELALHDWGADFAVWCSYKYLNAGPGAVAGCFIHERHALDPLVPRFGGWWGNDPATRFQMDEQHDFVPVPGAGGWQLSNPPVLAMAPLIASLALFDRAGMSALRARSLRLTGYLEHLLADLPGDRIERVTPADPLGRGCQLSWRIPGRAARVAEALATRGVIGDFRAPDVIRLAPAPLYNSMSDVRRAAFIVREFVAAP
jgi:kynureninase